MDLNRPLLRPGTLAILALAALAVFAVGCRAIASPEGWAAPVLDEDGDLLLVSHRDRLVAIDAQDLGERWRFPAEEDDIDAVALYGTPAVGDGAVFVPTWHGTLYALDKETGAVRWSYEADGELVGAATFSEDTVYFGSSDGKVYALDAESGHLRWRPFEADDSVWSGPAVAGEVVYVTSLDRRVYALDAATGAELWSLETGAGIAASPVVDEARGLVYVGGFDGRLRAIDVETREEKWLVGADNWFWSSAVVGGGTVYAGSLDRRVYAADAGTGELRWPMPFSTMAAIKSAPVIANGVLVVVDRDGNVYAIDLETGGEATAGGPLALESEVLADPVVVPSVGSREGESDARGEDVLIVTTGGEVVRIDPTTLQRIGSLEDVGG